MNPGLTSSHPSIRKHKGSLSLRSENMRYGKGTLYSKWHEARESEPKDYDFSKFSKKDLHRGTYKRILDITQGHFFEETSYQHSNKQILIKDSVTFNVHKKLINMRNFSREFSTPRPCLPNIGCVFYFRFAIYPAKSILNRFTFLLSFYCADYYIVAYYYSQCLS